MRQLIRGDNMNILPQIPDGLLDLVVTDPPYAWHFMGREWDKALPSVKCWREHLRVLKPGAFAFVMSGPRMDCLSEMGKRLAEAGFNISFSPIFHCFASGFPKAMSISKAIDRRLGAEREVVVGKTSHYQTGKGHSMVGNVDESWPEPYQEGDAAKGRDVLAPATPEAQALNGSYAGFQPKPSVEVVIVAMKPLAHGMYLDQALDNRKGISWLDDCRIPYDGQQPTGSGDRDSWRNMEDRDDRQEHGKNITPPTSRFPANLLVSDNAVDDGRERKSGELLPHHNRAEERNVYGKYSGADWSGKYFGGDSGGFSRYFSLDKWWQERLKKLPVGVRNTFPFLVTPKAARNEKWFICRVCDEAAPASRPGRHRGHEFHCDDCGTDFQEEMREEHGNHKIVPNFFFHPTQKPVDLMTYLVVLGSRKGDIIGDFFAGTGTTGWAAEASGRSWVMVDSDEDSVKISSARMKHLARMMGREV